MLCFVTNLSVPFKAFINLTNHQPLRRRAKLGPRLGSLFSIIVSTVRLSLAVSHLRRPGLSDSDSRQSRAATTSRESMTVKASSSARPQKQVLAEHSMRMSFGQGSPVCKCSLVTMGRHVARRGSYRDYILLVCQPEAEAEG